MNSRIPYYILAVLALVAIIWRIANPPPPAPPGPLGRIPMWDMTKIGDMSSYTVSPDAKLWAGAWNQKTKSKKLRSAVWVVGMESLQVATCKLPDGSWVSSVWWVGDKSLRALVLDSNDPAHADKAKIVEINPADGTIEKTTSLDHVVAAVLDCSKGNCLAALPRGSDAGFAVMSGDAAREIALGPPTNPGTNVPGRLGPDGCPAIVLAADQTARGKDAYYAEDLRVAAPGTKLFGLDDLPGRVEGMWLSPGRILMVISERDKFHELYYDFAQSKLTDLSMSDFNMDVARIWPDAPKSMMFITYNGGYRLTLSDAKVKRLMSFKKLPRESMRWRNEVQDGRMYPRKDGDFTAVSFGGNSIDIRVIKKNGTVGADILPRR